MVAQRSVTNSVVLVLLLLAFALPARVLKAVPDTPTPTGELVFVSHRNDALNIYTINVDGSNLRQVTNYSNPIGLGDPHWSVDGTMVIYSVGFESFSAIELVRYDGFLFPFLRGSPDQSTGPMDLSYDGRTVVYGMEEDFCFVSAEFQVPFYEECSSFYGQEPWYPSWAPNGQRIAYAAGGWDNDDIFTIQRDGTNVITLTNHPADDSQPAWSPDGTKIAFVSNRNGNHRLFVMNVDGSNVQQLTSSTANDSDPTWSPDGHFIAFTRTLADGNAELFVMHADGSNQTQLTHNTGYDGQPDWKPASQSNPQKVLLLSSSTGGKVAGVPFRDEDILAYNLATDRWSLYFDGSDVGITTDIDALGRTWDGALLLSFPIPTTLPGIGLVDDSDLVRFVPTTLGTTTSGVFTLFARGSELSLTTDSEDIDALYSPQYTDFYFSTSGRANVPDVIAQDEDLIHYKSDVWAANYRYLAFDGSALGLTTASEDIGGMSRDGDHTYYSTVGNFAMPGLSGKASDIFEVSEDANGQLVPTLFWSGTQHGFGSEVIDAFEIADLTDLTVNAAAVEESEAPEVGDDMDEDYITPDEEIIYLPLIHDGITTQ